MHPAALSEEQLLAECRVRRQKRSGPGGQHRNKVETAVIIEHLPTGIRGEAGERRSQAENQQAARFRLRMKLALAVRTTPDPDAPPSSTWQQRVQAGVLNLNPQHRDFPALLAEALDGIAASDFDLAAAAERLRVSNSQLLKLLRQVPECLAEVNRQRRERGRHGLK